MEKGSCSFRAIPDKKACGPFRSIKDPSMVMDPKAKSKANFWGAMIMVGRKEKDKEIRNTPTKNMPANCASLAGESAKLPSPFSPSPACANLSFAAPATIAALSFASRAFEAAWTLASLAFVAALLPKSLAIADAAFPRSAKTSLAWQARSAAAPKPLATSLCHPWTCCVRSVVLAFSAAFSRFCLASSAAEATCFPIRLAALEKLAQAPPSPFSSSISSAPVALSSFGTGS
mmetsp:Transcript_19828/g.46314  ORF Transcript_19828/g.46314 Transcript_19828/m.46314 type:complete len:232 (-) Transcript_19828:263-958(-)